MSKAVLFLVLTTMAPALQGDKGEDRAPSPTELVSPNQPVSLVGPEAPSPKSGESDPDSAAKRSVTDLPRSSTGASAEETISASVPPSATVRRTKSFSEVPTTAGSVPWYRTGWGALAIVLGLIGLLYAGLRRWTPLARGSEGGVLQIVARASLTPKHGLALVQLGRRFVLAGFTADSVSVLSEIGDEEEVADLAMRLQQSSGQKHSVAFEQRLTRENELFHRRLAGEPGSSRNGDRIPRAASSSLSDLLSKLKSLQAQRPKDATMASQL